LKPVDVFKRFVPENAVNYCAKLYETLSFEFKIKKARRTKFGDYRFDRLSGEQTITINNDLNPYAFLITYLHEVAHLLTFQTHLHRVSPHGKEWKQQFKKVSTPMLKQKVFPDEIMDQVIQYLSNPKASSCSDPVLYELLKRYDPANDKIFLKSVLPGQHFEFNGKTYQFLEKKRTRIVCVQIENGRKYLINQLAEVSLTSF
jgi:SprT protein